jgi:predicted RNase H-like HicB family nuclease
MKLKVIIHKSEEGGYWAEVPALPGCVTQGETLQEIETNIREAIDLYIETANDSVNNADEMMELAY